MEPNEVVDFYFKKLEREKLEKLRKEKKLVAK